MVDLQPTASVPLQVQTKPSAQRNTGYREPGSKRVQAPTYGPSSRIEDPGNYDKFKFIRIATNLLSYSSEPSYSSYYSVYSTELVRRYSAGNHPRILQNSTVYSAIIYGDQGRTLDSKGL